jgi:hypothetical protein
MPSSDQDGVIKRIRFNSDMFRSASLEEDNLANDTVLVAVAEGCVPCVIC